MVAIIISSIPSNAETTGMVLPISYLTNKLTKDIKYSKKMGANNDIPFVVEVAYIPDDTLEGVKFHFGLNFAPAASDPLQGDRLVYETKKEDFEGQGIKGLASRYKVSWMDKIHIVCHMTYPRFRFKDRGKTILEVGNE